MTEQTEREPVSFGEFEETWNALLVAQELVGQRERANAQLNERIAALEEQRRQYDNALQMERQRHEQDIERIGERLIQEAEQRDWCSEFDRVVNELNGSLHISLPTRSQDYDVTLTYTVTVNWSVNARDEEAAISQAQEEIGDYEIRQAVNAGAYEIDYESCEASERY